MPSVFLVRFVVIYTFVTAPENLTPNKKYKPTQIL